MRATTVVSVVAVNIAIVIINAFFMIRYTTISGNIHSLETEEYHFIYKHNSNRIPKIIHQTWKTETLPNNFRNWSNSVKQIYSNWKYKLWTDEDNRNFVAKQYPQYIDIYDLYNTNIKKVDMVRYLYLYHFGGMYIDLDFEALKPIDNLFYILNEKVILGQLGDGNCANCIPNAIMISVSKHPFWLHIINLMILRRNHNVLDGREVEYHTGPKLLKHAYETYNNKSEIMVLNSHYFYPIDWKTKTGQKYRKNIPQNPKKEFPNSYFVTYWTHSWEKETYTNLHPTITTFQNIITRNTTEIFIDCTDNKNDTNPISKYFDAIFVITMPQRKQYITNTMVNHYGLDKNKLIFVDALQSSAINNSATISQMIELNILKNKQWNHKWIQNDKLHSFHEISCALTHMLVWNIIYFNKCIQKALIFEDDVAKQNNRSNFFIVFDETMKAMNHIDDNWKCINFGRCWDRCDKDKIIHNVELNGIQLNTSIIKSVSPQCTHAYAISSDGINTLLSSGQLLPIVHALDVSLVKIFDSNHHYSTSPQSFKQNTAIKSTIHLNVQPDSRECAQLQT